MLCADVLDLFPSVSLNFETSKKRYPTARMVHTRRNEYLPIRKEQVVKNLKLLETTFDATTQSGKSEQWGDWHETIQDNATSVLAYIERNEFRMEDVEAKIEEIDGEVKCQIDAAEKNCTDHTNLAKRYQDSIRRKELAELKEELGSRISTFESCAGADIHRPPGIPSEWTQKLDTENVNLMEEFETDEKRLVFMKSCVGLVNGLFKTEWLAHVQAYVKVLIKNDVENMIHSNHKRQAQEIDSNMSQTFSEENQEKTEELKTAVNEVTEVVNKLQKDFKKMKQTAYQQYLAITALEKEVTRLQQIDKFRAEQVLKLTSFIKNMEKKTRQMPQIDMLYSISKQIQVRCAQLEDRQGYEAPSN